MKYSGAEAAVFERDHIYLENYNKDNGTLL